MITLTRRMRQFGSVVLLMVTVLLVRLDTTHSANILLVPINLNSHMIYYSRLGEGLSRLGHSVHLLAPHNARINQPSASDTNYTISHYTVAGDVPFSSKEEISQR